MLVLQSTATIAPTLPESARQYAGLTMWGARHSGLMASRMSLTDGRVLGAAAGVAVLMGVTQRRKVKRLLRRRDDSARTV